MSRLRARLVGSALEGVDAVYVAFEADILDERVVRCFMPKPGGLAVAQAEAVLRETSERAALDGIGFTGLIADTLNVEVILRLLEAVGLSPSPPARARPPTKMQRMASPRIDVSIEHKRSDPGREAGKESSEHLSRVWLALPR